ncbi:MAG: phosphatidate cytidylyltransferase [Phycisphaerales bacterium]
MLSLRLITGPLLIVGWLVVMAIDNWLDGVRWPAWSQPLLAWRGGPPRGILLGAILLLAIVPLGARELGRMIEGNGIATRRWLLAISAAAALVVLALWPEAQRGAALAMVVVAALVASMLVFARGRTIEGVLAASGAILVGVAYLGLMPGFILLLRQHASAWLIVGVILATKACDIGAYFTGRAIGRHKLIPWLSPGKTWEGLAGGIVAGAAAGAGLAALAAAVADGAPATPAYGALCGALFAVVGQLGDLGESLLKRGAGLKDSGSLLPGMGGVLDVLDSPLLVAPVAWWMLGGAAGGT